MAKKSDTAAPAAPKPEVKSDEAILSQLDRQAPAPATHTQTSSVPTTGNKDANLVVDAETLVEAMGPVRAGYKRVVIPDYDPLLREGRPGESARIYGGVFYLDRNGDLIGDLPEAAADAHIVVRRMVAVEDHNPAPPMPIDEIQRARRRGRVLTA